MAAVRFVLGDDSSPRTMTLTFAGNPSFPQANSRPADIVIDYEAADGTPYEEIVGRGADVPLTWPPEGPMTDEDFVDLQQFWRYTRGKQDRFTYRDAGGVEHQATFVEGPEAFAQVAHGFAGTIVLRVLS